MGNIVGISVKSTQSDILPSIDLAAYLLNLGVGRSELVDSYVEMGYYECFMEISDVAK